eukprot:6008852-Ditylum_brightwellii.AAC.1
MRTAKEFSRETIQLVNTKRPPIEFEVEKGVTDKKLGENRTYKLCTQPKEEKCPVKQVLKGQKGMDRDALYILVQDLLRGNTLTAFNNKQATFDKQTPENLEHCLNTVTVHVFPSKAYKLQKRYIWNMMYKPRHISLHNWIARVIELNNYLEEFPMPTGIVAKTLEDEEILQVLENKIPTSWKFLMDKKGSNVSSSMIKKWKPVFSTRSVSQKKLRKAVQLMRATLREDESAKPNTKLAKRLTVTGDKILHVVIQMSKDVTIASTM